MLLILMYPNQNLIKVNSILNLLIFQENNIPKMECCSDLAKIKENFSLFFKKMDLKLNLKVKDNHLLVKELNQIILMVVVHFK
jgi:hypothetical protein